MTEIDTIDFYWRPGCPFCARLEQALDTANVPMTKRNIWNDPDAAAFVRSVADGNETVPTVIVGQVAMVNPSIDLVLETVATHAPHLLDATGSDG